MAGQIWRDDETPLVGHSPYLVISRICDGAWCRIWCAKHQWYWMGPSKGCCCCYWMLNDLFSGVRTTLDLTVSQKSVWDHHLRSGWRWHHDPCGHDPRNPMQRLLNQNDMSDGEKIAAPKESRNFHVGGASNWRPVWVVVSNLVVPESLISHRSPTYSNLWIKKRLDIFKNNPGEKFQSVGPADWSDWINLTCALLLDMPTLGGRTTGKCHAPTPRLPLEHVGPLHVILLGSKAPH